MDEPSDPPRSVRNASGRTRAADAPLDSEVAEAYSQVQPPGFGDNPRSAIETADADVDDTIGAE